MKVICTICTEPVTEDFAAAPCGHTFHYTCLSQWLAHQKTCPQCRERCLPRNVIKLFIDVNDRSTLSADLSTLDSEELKEKLGLQANLLKHKDQALSEAKATLEEIREEMQAWQAQHEATHKRLKTEQTANSALKKQLSVMHYECDQAKEARKEASHLKQKLSTMEGLQKVLKDSKEEVEILVKNYTSPAKLATFVVAMKRDYEVLKERKLNLQKEKDKLLQDVSYAKRQLRTHDSQLQSCRARVLALESDLQASEQEKDNLQRKVEMLEKALESPGSRVALRRILESPMPDPTCTKKVQADLGASPLLVTNTERSSTCLVNSTNDRKKLTGSKRSNSEDAVLLPVNKVSKKLCSENFASGFNGMGGQTKFAVPKSRPLGQKPASKGLKFAPRSMSHSKPKSIQTPLPTLQLKF